MTGSFEKDKTLYKRFVDGDNRAFEELVIAHKDNLIYFLSRYVPDIHTCEDIAQDAFAAVYVHKDRYDMKRPFKTYLFAIAKNKATDYIRKNAAIILLGEEDIIAQEDELFNRVVKNDEQRLVHNTMRLLKVDYQKALLLVDIIGLSYKEAADVLGKTPQGMKVLIFRARQALKNQLVKGGYTNEN